MEGVPLRSQPRCRAGRASLTRCTMGRAGKSPKSSRGRASSRLLTVAWAQAHMSLEQVGTSCLACPDPGSALSLTRTVASWADKASRFAASCSRHGGEAGAVVQVRITFTNPKYVRFNDNTWQAEGFDACRADRTSASANPEVVSQEPKPGGRPGDPEDPVR